MRLLATAKMPRGVLQRYRTRMMTADGETFDEPSARWSSYYQQYGWATQVVDEPAPTPARAVRRSRGRPAKAAKPLAEMKVADLRKVAKSHDVELPSGYVKHDDLVDILKQEGVEKPEESGGEDDDAGRF